MAAAVASLPQTPGYGPARPDPPVQDEMEWDADDAFDQAIANFDEKQNEVKESTDRYAMRAFYSHLLPWKSIFVWLNHDLVQRPGKLFTHREFAFTLANDAYLRYNSFGTWQELKKEIMRLEPARFEIGPVYTGKPKDKKTASKSAFRPQFRELVLDIDMTDYDEIRTCCSGGAICKRCWAFIAVAVEVLDDTLRSDFGFKHILWVYSGRRGIHAWISDRSACELPDDARRAIVGWLEIVKGSANMAKKVETGADFPGRSLHPSLRRAIDGPLKRAFTETVLVDQDCFRGEDGSKMLLQLLPPKEEAAKTSLRNKWTGKSKSSFEKWTDVMLIAKKNEKVWGPYCEDIVLQYTYPRIDAEVSKHMNHLLKSPWACHPGTGRVCVPLEASQVAAFDPTVDCPTVARLIREQDRYAARVRKEGLNVDPTANGWEHTSLKPFVDHFDRHCQAIVKETDALRRARTVNSTEF